MYTEKEFMEKFSEVVLPLVHSSKTKKGDIGKYYMVFYRIPIHDNEDHLIIVLTRKTEPPKITTITEIYNDDQCTDAFVTIFPVKPDDIGDFGKGKFNLLLKNIER